MIKELTFSQQHTYTDEVVAELRKELDEIERSITSAMDLVHAGTFDTSKGAIFKARTEMKMSEAQITIDKAKYALEEGESDPWVLDFLFSRVQTKIYSVNLDLKKNQMLSIPGQKKIVMINYLKDNPMENPSKEEVEQLKEDALDITYFLDKIASVITIDDQESNEAISDKTIALAKMKELKMSLSSVSNIPSCDKNLLPILATAYYLNNKIEDLNEFFRKYDVTMDK